MNESPVRMGGRTVVVALLLSSAAGLAWLFWARGRAMSRPTPAVALLPFQSGSPETAYLSDALTMELIRSLSKVEKLRVTSWNIAAQFRGKAGSLKELRDGLQAGAVVDGSVRKQGDRLLVTVKLIDANSGEAIWSDSLDRPEREIFQIQERIAKGIVYALNVPMRMDPQRILVPVRTDSMLAYDSYLRARAALRVFSREGLAKSSEFAEKAIAEDPKFSPAYGLLAANYGLFQQLSEESLGKAKVYGRKAVELDSSSPEAHEALGMALAIGEWDWKAAKLEFERALQWAPNSAEAHAAFALGYLMPMADLEGAEYEAHKAVELDGRSLIANSVAAEVMLARHNLPDHLKYFQAANQICRDCPRMHLQQESAQVNKPDVDAIFKWLNLAIDRHMVELAFLQTDDQYTPLRKDARYAAALKRIGLKE